MIKRLAKILEEYVNDDIELSLETNILTDLELDSFDLMQIVSEIEDEFDIIIEDRNLMEIKTVGDIVNFIEN